MSKVFNDAVHGSIEVHPLAVAIIDTPQFQRLRFIKQLGVSHFVYPSATHSRFEHCIGVSHVAGVLARALKERQPELKITDKDVLCVELAGLCHDLGHGPFSHLWEEFMHRAKPEARWKHEKTSVAMLDHLIRANHLQEDLRKYDLDGEDLTFVKELITKPEGVSDPPSSWPYKGRPREKGFLYQIVANEENGVDVDKWDYILRDGHCLGVQVTFDLARLAKSCRVIDASPSGPKICFRDKEVTNLYDMFQARLLLHKKAYQHRVIKTINTMLLDALILANEHITYQGEQGTPLPLSEISSDMVALTFFHDDVFHSIHRSSSLHPNMTRAKDILQHILTRRYYPLVGHTVPTSTDLAPTDFLDQMMMNLPEEATLRREDLDVQLVTLNYGNGGQNPLLRVGFFCKEQPSVYLEHHPSEASILLPALWEEKIFRVVCRQYDEQRLKQAKIAFLKACQNFRVATPNRKDMEKPSGPAHRALQFAPLPSTT